MTTRLSRLITIALLCLIPLGAMAETSQPAAPAQPLLKQPEVDQLVAPIALHPDPLLSQILIASTYPLEVVQGDRWAKSNKNVKGDALTAALAKQSWDDSIKSLVQAPEVLSMMAEQLDWTQKLGDAMLAQQADVMDAIQRLRGKAQANGKLKTTKEQTVSVQTEDQKQYIAIEPTSTSEIYVPYYEPAVVYGDWPYPDYAPYYFAPPYGYFPGAALATGIAFAAAGIAIGNNWGWGRCDWGRNQINLLNKNVNINNINRNDRNNFSNWQHNADHRHGVKYNNADVRQKFAKNDLQAGKGARQDFRGKDGQQVLNPDRDRPGAGDRDRPVQATEIVPARAIETAPVPEIVTGQAPAIAIVPVPVIATAAAVARRRARARRAAVARRRASGRARARNRASGRASRSATPVFQTSNQAPGRSSTPIAAVRAWAVAEERPGCRMAVADRAWVVAAAAAAVVVAAVAAAAAAGAPTCR